MSMIIMIVHVCGAQQRPGDAVSFIGVSPRGQASRFLGQQTELMRGGSLDFQHHELGLESRCQQKHGQLLQPTHSAWTRGHPLVGQTPRTLLVS